LFGGMKPILLWGSFRAASRLPECKGQGRDIIVSECGDTVPGRSFQRMLMSISGMLEDLARLLVSGQVILLAVLLGSGAVSVRGSVVQLRRTLMVLVM
jgi:hypothetical protein